MLYRSTTPIHEQNKRASPEKTGAPKNVVVVDGRLNDSPEGQGSVLWMMTCKPLSNPLVFTANVFVFELAIPLIVLIKPEAAGLPAARRDA